MKKENKKLLLLILLIVIVGGVILLIPSEPKAAQVAQTEEAVEDEETAKKAAEIEATNIIVADDQAPDFTVEMTDGQSITLESLRGKVVLLNFWATWCPPCREELTRVPTEIIERFEGRDFVFLPVSRGEERDVVVKFLEENNYTFAAGLDTDQSIYNLYAKNYIPRNYIINRHGVVVKATIGNKEFDELVQTIEMTLNAR